MSQFKVIGGKVAKVTGVTLNDDFMFFFCFASLFAVCFFFNFAIYWWGMNVYNIIMSIIITDYWSHHLGRDVIIVDITQGSVV